MQSDQQRRKRKQRFLKPPYFITSSYYYFIRCCILFLFLLFFLFFNGFTFESDFLFKSVLGVFRSTSVSLASSLELCPVRVEDWVLFPDHVLLLVSKRSRLSWLNLHGGLDCIYRQGWTNSSFEFGDSGKLVALPVLSVDEYNELQSIARCPLPPSNYSAMVELRKRVIRRKDGDNNLVLVNQTVHSWEMLVYAAALDGETAVVFVKGLNLRPDRVSDPAQFSCHFDWNDSEKSGKYALNTNAVTAAQEIIRCSLPLSLKKYPTMAHGLGVSISIASHPGHRDVVGSRGRGEAIRYDPAIPSVAKIIHSEEQAKNKYELCACTMLWNQATSLREWIVYHAWLGVERWFIYDNNSNDGIEKVIEELNQEKFNVSRHVWPWIKSQEAGFSHCILKARRECKWVAFMDVDEFFYFPFPTANRLKKINLGYPGRHSLRSLVAKFSSSKTIGEIRTVCHSFGPSGLSLPPSQGVMVGYTCRLQSPERHKSIVRLDALDSTLLNVVHHFHLRSGYRYLNSPQSTIVINHYKYQVWESFRTKFFRRVATYVTDWKENQNEGSKDRAPGLGTEAIEPPNWPLQFCEVWDTGLRDFVISNLADPITGMLPWEVPLI